MTPADLIGYIIAALALLLVGAGGKTWLDARKTTHKTEEPDEKPDPTPAPEYDSNADADVDDDIDDLRARAKARLDELRRLRNRR